MTEKVILPEHITRIIDQTDRHSKLVGSLNCFSVAALFYFPELLETFISGDRYTNSEVAEKYLFKLGKFELASTYVKGTRIAVYSHSKPRKNWFFNHQIAHVQVCVGAGLVLAKAPSNENSRLELMQSNIDLQNLFGASRNNIDFVTLVKWSSRLKS